MFVLPNAPILKSSTATDLSQFSTDQLIEWNGNHWRKIFTIAAKIITDHDWKLTRQKTLLEDADFVFKTPSVLEDCKRYFICGQTMQTLFSEHFGMLPWQAIDSDNKIRCHKMVYFCPYLDYRQFSNANIAKLKAYLMAH